MWSAGVLLYVMLVGRYPFYDTTAARLFDKIRTGEFCVPLALDCTLDARIIMHSLLRLQAAKR
jgi:tribbles-like protein